MKRYIPLLTGTLALGTEVLIFLSLMEMPPFGKGGSDIIWGLPFFGVMILAMAMAGLTSGASARSKAEGNNRLITTGLILNALSLIIPILLLVFGVARALLSSHR